MTNSGAVAGSEVIQLYLVPLGEMKFGKAPDWHDMKCPWQMDTGRNTAAPCSFKRREIQYNGSCRIAWKRNDNSTV